MAPPALTKQGGELRILCIDGGGIRGLIPAKILEYLESELQRIDGSDARLAHYFDFMVGTSTGALITTLLTAPNMGKRPLCTAKEIIDLYLEEGSGIFRNDHKATWAQVVLEAVLLYIKYYDGSNETLRYLHGKLIALGPDVIQPVLLLILNGLNLAMGPSSAPAAACATANGGGQQQLGVESAHDHPVSNGVEFAQAPARIEDYIQEHAEVILQRLCHAHGLPLDSPPFQDGIKEFAEGLRKTLLNPDFIRHALLRPKYDGEGLRKVVTGKLGKHRLQETVTNVVVPTFDIKRNQPVVFSTSKARQDGVMDPCLSDICIAATAAPTFFPVHYFKTLDSEEFNLIDAGLFANNPTTVAMNEVWRMKDRGEELPVEILPTNCRNLRILSIGTGVVNHSYTADECNWWGLLPWVYNVRNKSLPLIETLMYSTGSLVDYNVALVFKSHNCEENYLRIQDDNLDPALGALDDTSNMEKLIKIGENLLDRPVHRTDCETRKYQPVEGAWTNKKALTKLAEELVAEGRRRGPTEQPQSVTETTGPPQKRLKPST